MVEIRRLLVLILFVICCGLLSETVASDNKGYKCVNNTYSSTGRVAGKTAPTLTPFTWSDSKGKTYPIYMSSNGSCFIIKKSNKTGKEYKSYLGTEISRDICAKMNKAYKGK